MKARRARTSFQAQAALVLGLVLFGSWRGDVQLAKRAAAVVEDADRSAAAAEICRSIERELEAARTELIARRDELLRRLAPYDAAVATDPASDAEFQTLVWKRQERLLQLRYELRAQMTPPEWQRLYRELREARDAR